MEAMPGFDGSCGRDCDFGRALVEIAPELAGRVTESQNLSGDAAPIDLHRINDGAENPQRVRRIEAIRNGENIEHCAHIAYFQSRSSVIKIYMAAATGVMSAPEYERTSHNSRVIRMGTQRAPETVKSYKSDLAMVFFIIQGDERALHKAHVRVEVVLSALASVEVRADARE